jgi:hypothetical protein
METLFLLAFGEEDFLASLAMAGSEAFFNKLLIRSEENWPAFCLLHKSSPSSVLQIFERLHTP